MYARFAHGAITKPPLAVVFSLYEVEHLFNLVQLGMDARKCEVYRARRRQDHRLRPLNHWERHLLIMDRKVAQKIMEACRTAFGEENP